MTKKKWITDHKTDYDRNVIIIKYCKRWGLSVHDATDLIVEIDCDGVQEPIKEVLKEYIRNMWKSKGE